MAEAPTGLPADNVPGQTIDHAQDSLVRAPSAPIGAAKSRGGDPMRARKGVVTRRPATVVNDAGSCQAVTDPMRDLPRVPLQAEPDEMIRLEWRGVGDQVDLRGPLMTMPHVEERSQVEPPCSLPHKIIPILRGLVNVRPPPGRGMPMPRGGI